MTDTTPDAAPADGARAALAAAVQATSLALAPYGLAAIVVWAALAQGDAAFVRTVLTAVLGAALLAIKPDGRGGR